MKRVFSVLAAIALFGAVACGGDDDDNRKPNTGGDTMNASGDTMMGGDDMGAGLGIFEVCSPINNECMDDMICKTFPLDNTPRCQPACEFNGGTAVVPCPGNPGDYICWTLETDPVTGNDVGVCHPNCDSAAACAAYPDTFCQDLTGQEIFTCYTTNGDLFEPCDATHPCMNDPQLPMTCGTADRFDPINDICLVDCSAQNICESFYYPGFYCVNDVCNVQNCATAWDNADCGGDPNTCFGFSDGPACMDGGDATVGEECGGFRPLGDPAVDPLCTTNQDCAFTSGQYYQDGICLEMCESDMSPDCTTDLLGNTTTCLYDSTTDFNPDNTAPYVGQCGVECTGTLTYNPSTGDITGGTADAACTDVVLSDCYLVEGDDDDMGTVNVTKGICGLARN